MNILSNTLMVTLLSFSLIGCASTEPINLLQTKIIVADPPKSLFKCPQIQNRDVPDFSSLTDQEIADFITLVLKHNKTCGLSQKQVQRWIADAKKNVEATNLAANPDKNS